MFSCSRYGHIEKPSFFGVWEGILSCTKALKNRNSDLGKNLLLFLNHAGLKSGLRKIGLNVRTRTTLVKARDKRIATGRFRNFYEIESDLFRAGVRFTITDLADKIAERIYAELNSSEPTFGEKPFLLKFLVNPWVYILKHGATK